MHLKNYLVLSGIGARGLSWAIQTGVIWWKAKTSNFDSNYQNKNESNCFIFCFVFNWNSSEPTWPGRRRCSKWKHGCSPWSHEGSYCMGPRRLTLVPWESSVWALWRLTTDAEGSLWSCFGLVALPWGRGGSCLDLGDILWGPRRQTPGPWRFMGSWMLTIRPWSRDGSPLGLSGFYWSRVVGSSWDRWGYPCKTLWLSLEMWKLIYLPFRGYSETGKAHPRSVEAHPRTLEPGRLTLEAWRLTLEPWRLTFEPWRLTLEP
jgi:hypothetical protein